VRVVVLATLASVLLACDMSGQPAEVLVPAPPRNLDPVLLEQGKGIHDKYCKRCHGANAEGSSKWRAQGPDGKYPPPPLNGEGHTWHHPKAVLTSVIKNGSPGGMGNMPAFRDKLSDADIDAVIIWMQSLWSEQAYQMWYQRDISHSEH